MSYRIEELIRLIIPGLYLAAIAVGIFISNKWTEITGNNGTAIINFIDSTSGIILLLIPFLGFILGYIVEVLMSFIEHAFYFFGCRRPSKDVLQGFIFKSFNPYTLNKRENIALKLGIKNNDYTNKICGEALQKAKQSIDMSKVRSFYYSSIFARNIFGCQVITTVLLFVYVKDCGFEFLSILLSILFLVFWIHMNHVYVKYVFAEYGKSLS